MEWTLYLHSVCACVSHHHPTQLIKLHCCNSFERWKGQSSRKTNHVFFPSHVVSITFHVLLSCHPISFFTKEGCTFVFLSSETNAGTRYKTMKSSCTDGFIEVKYGRKNLVSDWKEEAIRKRCIERVFFLLFAVTFGFCFIDNVLDFLSFLFKHKIGFCLVSFSKADSHQS